MKPAWIILAAASVGGLFLLESSPLEGDWVSTRERHGGRDGFTLAAKGGKLSGKGVWHTTLSERPTSCPVDVAVTFVSSDERRMIGLVEAGGACTGERTPIDCVLSPDKRTLDCGAELEFGRVK
jgi:hypothetical protein